MKTIFASLAVSLAMTGAVAAKDMSATDKQITAVEDGIAKAFVDKDTKALDGYFADDWTLQTDEPKSSSKAQMIKLVKAGDLAATSMVNTPLVIRVVGSIAIVQGGDNEKSSFKGKDTSGLYTWTDILENKGGKWVSIATQVTKVK